MNDVVTKNLVVYIAISLLSVFCLSASYIINLDSSYIIEAVFFGLFYYIKNTWFFIIWIILQNILMFKKLVSNIYWLIIISILLNTLIAYCFWDGGQNELFEYLIIIAIMSAIFTTMIYNFTSVKDKTQ